MSVRIRDLVIPDLASTEQAMAWGLTLNESQRATLMEAYRALINTAIHTANLQDRVNMITEAQRWREAAETKPAVSGQQSEVRFQEESIC